MKELELFSTRGDKLTNVSFLKALRDIKADEADILYIHTSLNFGSPNRELRRKEIVESLFDVLMELGVSTLIFPTYTFSFCNGMNYDLNHSKSPMGLLNEYARTHPDAIRSIDPLMSNALIGKHSNFVKGIGKFSVGKNSTFDLLHRTHLKVKFLFLGPKIGDCFTHMHYIEDERNVPYRYNRSFSGEINDGQKIYDDTYELYVRYSNVFPGCGSYIYENLMLERGIAKRVEIGSSSITVVEEKAAYNSYVELLTLSPSFYITEIFKPNKNTKDFHAVDMVAL